ncbi:aldose 1-epimerase family protein [Nibrella saemangeumensis]|uniref:Aldose 1-epimerase family protein n=1 Tax=Nibrella saemangeumensis TaxID=1084526 RepID=A0ABP8MAG7_9BACT
MTTLENDYLRIDIQWKGAELASIYDKTTETEHLWQANPDVWPWHGPNLFPVVGGCLNNQIVVDGNRYPMERHGFARHSTFDLTDSSETVARFSLRANESTLAAYPYQFNYEIWYELEDRLLKVAYRVTNEDDQPIYFSVGAHPAFNVPFYPDETYEDYYLEFELDEPLERHLLSKEGFFTGETQAVHIHNRRLPLTQDLFAQDALVFKNLSSRQVTIRSINHDQIVSVSFLPFNYLGIWAKPGAPFVCIEPWLGCADTEGRLVDIREKEAIQRVDPGQLFEAAFIVGISPHDAQ